jgi:tellurite resistance protein TehA-like permease
MTEHPPNPLTAAAEGLFPGAFALVMATGIVAIAATQQDLDVLADLLYAIAAGAYVVLAVLMLVRIVRFPRRVAGDIASHARGFALLTVVAGTNVLGSASAIVHDWWDLAWALWWVSLPLWAGLVYGVVAAVVLRPDKPPLAAAVNGTWFLLTVATQSIVALGALLLTRTDNELLAFACLAWFGVGIVLYLMLMTIVFLRWVLHPLDPATTEPPTWIAAGAVAITVLAGANLLIVAPRTDRVDRVGPFLEGFVVTAWATATFWLPLMVVVGVWRHLVHRVPFRYHPSYWAMVFPLGMYSAATHRMRAAIALDPLGWLPRAAFAVAIGAWTITALGLLLHHIPARSRRTSMPRA